MLKRRLSGAPLTLPNGEPAPAPPLSIGAIILAGGSAGVAMWAVAIPPDVSGPHLLSRCSSASADGVDYQIPTTICSSWDLYWIRRLRQETHCGGWSDGALERFRTSYGQGFPGECELFTQWCICMWVWRMLTVLGGDVCRGRA